MMSALLRDEVERDMAAGAALSALLDRWGRFTPEWRRRILDALAVTVAMAMRRWRLDADAAAEDVLASRIGAWKAVLGPATREADLAALRAAYLTIGGAERWPEALLGATRMPGFGEALRRSVPVPMPPAAPLAMPVQSL